MVALTERISTELAAIDARFVECVPCLDPPVVCLENGFGVTGKEPINSQSPGIRTPSVFT
jgi:hypothetical protein